MSIYDKYASVYDDSGQIAFSLQMVPYLGELLERHPVPRGTLLELACGTGTVAVNMAQAGWRVFGVDGSAQMLALAQEKAATAQEDAEHALDLHWLQQDMRRVSLPEPVMLVTCLYDSLNYMLSSDDLAAVFRAVHGSLEPGGLFLFDMNTAWALATHWDGQTYVTDTRNLTVILESNYDSRKQRTRVRVICFQRTGELYRKIVEEHTEQAYPREHIATLLSDVGFAIEGVYHCFTFSAPSASSPRLMWAARKPNPTKGTRSNSS